jgi:hypothetical protein
LLTFQNGFTLFYWKVENLSERIRLFLMAQFFIFYFLIDTLNKLRAHF